MHFLLFLYLFVDHLSLGNICPPGSGISIKVFQVRFGNLFHFTYCSCLVSTFQLLLSAIYFFLHRELLSTKHFFSFSSLDSRDGWSFYGLKRDKTRGKMDETRTHFGQVCEGGSGTLKK